MANRIQINEFIRVPLVFERDSPEWDNFFFFTQNLLALPKESRHSIITYDISDMVYTWESFILKKYI